MALMPPKNYRFTAEQQIWLQKQAVKHDEGSLSRYLRRLISQAMKRKEF